MTALIVDDEIKACRILESLIQENFPQISLFESVGNVPDALKAIHQNNPDLVFLDIEMPGYTGFQLLELIGEPKFQIIFTTAYANYAIQAFEVSAIDYLLKPIRTEKLKAAIQKAIQRIELVGGSNKAVSTLRKNLKSTHLERLAVPVTDGLQFIEVADILMLEAEGAYTRIHTINESPLLISKMIKDFESALEDHPDFFRCHRSYLINLRHVVKYSRADGGSIQLRNNLEVYLARDKREAFIKQIEQFRI